MGRLDQDMGVAQVVTPGTTGDPFTDPSASNAVPASAPAGPEAVPAGQPEGTPSAPASTPAPTTEPAATAAPAAPPAPAPAPTPATSEPASPPATADPLPEPPAPLSVEDVLRARQEAEVETDAKWRARQGGQDRQMHAMETRLEASEAATEAQKQLTRDSMLNREGLTPEERTRMQQQWELDDREQKLNAFSTSTLELSDDVEIALLIVNYGTVPGVTEEALVGLPQEEREGFCKDQKIAFLESGGTPAPAANGAAPAAPAPVVAATPAVPPAGSSAPSDIGGSGSPPAPVTRNENPGAEAMADNIGNTGWQEATFPTRTGRR